MTKARTVRLREQQAEAAKLDALIAANIEELGYGGDWEIVALDSLIERERGIGIVQPGAPERDGVPIVRVSISGTGGLRSRTPCACLQPSRLPIPARGSRAANYCSRWLAPGRSRHRAEIAYGEHCPSVAVIRCSEWARRLLGEIGAARTWLCGDYALATQHNWQATLDLRDVAELPVVLPPQGQRNAIAQFSVRWTTRSN